MNFIHSFFAAFSMFSVLPVPQVSWGKEKIRYMLVALPFVGMVIGAGLCLWWKICEWLSFSVILRSSGLTLIPILISGGIHMDGYMDTMDALKSNASPEKKRAILKDPHSGAFASIGFGVYLLAYFGLCSELSPSDRIIVLLGLAPVMSRSLSAVSGTLLPVHSGEGTLNLFHKVADKTAGIIAVAWVVFSSLAMVLVWPLAGAVMTMGAVLTLLSVRCIAIKKFEGMSGDIAGFQLQMAELVMLSLLVLSERILTI